MTELGAFFLPVVPLLFLLVALLLGRYPGADGMKTGFTCPAGWNVVATAQHGSRKLIVVIFGAPSPRVRTNEAAMLFDRGFTMSATGQKLDGLAASTVTAPPNMRDAICRGRGRADMLAMQEEFVASATAEGAASFGGTRGLSMMTTAMAPPPAAAGAIADERDGAEARGAARLRRRRAAGYAR